MSLFVYNFVLGVYALLLRIASRFHPKARLFMSGRKSIFKKIADALEGTTRRIIWIHCASLGEFEQGRPVIEAIKRRDPDLAIFLTFFSPSGYEIKKDYPHADFIFYLPLDSRRNAIRLLNIINPVAALFVKYEFWFHYLDILHRRKIPVILFSAYFQRDQPFFKWYGGLYRKMLSFYRQIFVQDDESACLLRRAGFNQVLVSGDTRFDRAVKILTEAKSFSNVETFKGSEKLIIAGSSWPEDEALLHDAFLKLPRSYKLLIVPHETDASSISRIYARFGSRVCLWDADPQLLQTKDIAIVNTIGQLAYLYRYADIVWIGGGFGKGIHNIIEPAVYGLPVFFGPRFTRFREAREMIAEDAAKSLDTCIALAAAFQDREGLERMAAAARVYVHRQLGATGKIMDYLEAKCLSSTS